MIERVNHGGPTEELEGQLRQHVQDVLNNPEGHSEGEQKWARARLIALGGLFGSIQRRAQEVTLGARMNDLIEEHLADGTER